MRERRILWLVIALSLAQLLLLAAQAPGRGDGAGATPTLLGDLSLRAVAPVGDLVASIQGALGDWGESWRSRARLEEDNERLRRRLGDLESELIRLRGLQDEVERLAAALDAAPRLPGDLRPAEVVYLDHSSWLRTLVLQVGGSGARLDQPVVTVDGLVGRVVQVSGSYAKVQLLTDRSAAASAILERTRRQGLARGGLEGLALDFVPLQASVRPGDRVVTAGTDGIYPRGLPVGTVVSVEPGGELFHDILLTPAVDFSRLGQVYLLDRPEVPRELVEGAGDGG